MSATGAGRRWNLWSVGVALVFPLGALVFGREINDNSFLWHVRAGDVQIQTGQVLTADPFSFTRLGVPWRTQSWLVELGYAWLDARVGLRQVPWIVLACWVVFVTGVIFIVRRHTRSVPHLAIVLGLTAPVLVGFFNPRPVVFSFPLLVLLVLADDRRALRWTVPLIMWLFVAVHGSFAIAAVYLVLQAIRYRDPTRVPPLICGGVLSLLTAHGWGVLSILAAFGGNGETLDLMSEWDTPDLLSLPFFPILVLLVLFLAASMRGVLRPRDLWLIAPMLMVVFEANRTVPGAWILLLPLTAAATAEIVKRPSRSLVPATVPVLIGVVVTVAVIGAAPPLALRRDRFPVDATPYLTGSRLFANDGVGGYLIYLDWPDRLIYVDDRAELFGTEIREMVEVRGGRPLWREVFEERGFDEALLSPEDPLIELIEGSGWTVEFEDEDWVLLRRP